VTYNLQIHNPQILGTDTAGLVFSQASGTMNNLKHLLCGAMSAVFSKTTTGEHSKGRCKVPIDQWNPGA